MTASSEANQPSSRSNRRKFNVKILIIVLIVAVAASAVVYVVANRNGQAGNEVTTETGMRYVDLKVGDGATPQMGQRVRVHYIGKLQNGTEFENSYNQGPPVEFNVGPGLIAGWNEALQTMKVGGKRRIILPPHLAYGSTGSPPRIPPNATLTFEIELLGVRQ